MSENDPDPNLPDEGQGREADGETGTTPGT